VGNAAVGLNVRFNCIPSAKPCLPEGSVYNGTGTVAAGLLAFFEACVSVQSFGLSVFAATSRPVPVTARFVSGNSERDPARVESFSTCPRIVSR